MKIKMKRSKEVNVLFEKPKSLELKLRQCLTENAEMQTWVITPIRGGSACHLTWLWQRRLLKQPAPPKGDDSRKSNLLPCWSSGRFCLKNTQIFTVQFTSLQYWISRSVPKTLAKTWIHLFIHYWISDYFKNTWIKL